MMQQQPPDVTTLLYRLDAIERELAVLKTQYQLMQQVAQNIAAMERDIMQVKSQLNLYEPMRETDLKMQYIHSTLTRIETETNKIKDGLMTMNATMTTQDDASKKRDGEIKENLSKLQIRILYGLLTAFGTAFLAYLVNYFTHFIH